LEDNEDTHWYVWSEIPNSVDGSVLQHTGVGKSGDVGVDAGMEKMAPCKVMPTDSYVSYRVTIGDGKKGYQEAE
jgi:hypothetical protein